MNNFDDFNYIEFWDNHYTQNRTSGDGSYGELAEFKGEVVNKMIKKYDVNKIIDFGCGDGNQTKYMECKEYVGLDVSKRAVEICEELFENDSTKTFSEYNPNTFYCDDYKADMVLCLDVLYNIVSQKDFINTLDHIFQCANKIVVLYTRITPGAAVRVLPSMVDRDIISYLKKYEDFKIKEVIPQKYINRSSSHFIVLERKID